MVDEGPKAKWYYSDGYETYASLWFHFGRYEVSEGKSETYSVEADNAELRHYLARLARSSRCFSRCPYALHCAVLSACSSTASTSANSRAASSQTTPSISSTSLTH